MAARPRLLVVDDDDDLLFLLNELLQVEGFEVHGELSSDGGLLRMLGERWDAVIVDYRIDRRDGLELVREARAGGCTAPVLMLTGSANLQTEQAAMEDGFTQFVDKRDINGPGLARHLRWAIDHDRTLKALARSNRELARAVEQLERFAGVVGHDLRGPMHRIATTLELLELRFAAELGEEGSAMIGRTIGAVEQLGEVVDDLLAYARLNDVQFGEVHLDACLGRALAAHEDVIVERGAQVEHGAMGTVTGCRTHLTQLLQNLVGNALKFSPQEQPVVRIRSRSERGYRVLEVEDEGIGIPPEHHDRVFEMFQRLHQDDRYPGTGIGLATCAKVAEIHGGRIELESTPGSGSLFRVLLSERPPEPLPRGAWSPSN